MDSPALEDAAGGGAGAGALAETRIRRGTKIDNLVHVGHNCDIGEDVILVMGTGISGSSTVGKGAVLAGQVGIGDHAHIGPRRDSGRAGRRAERQDGDQRRAA
jgi:UDP-3-O-[3-hydroxymyristoyl] glucosamine N-acyltransferase